MAVHAGVVARGPDFPDGDGDPMPEQTSHLKQLIKLSFGFEQLLEQHPRAYVGGNHFLYYNPLDQRDNVAPDIYVALNVERRNREKYQTWDEDGKFPDLIVEILSPKTRKDDLGPKRELYARLGLREYYVHDPLPHARHRVTDGYHLVDGVLAPMARLAGGGYYSLVLGAELRVIDRWLRVIDPATGQPVPTPEEEVATRRAAQAAWRAEAAARHAVETQWQAAEIALQAAEERVVHESGERHAAEERAAQAERELAALRTLLAAQQGSPAPPEDGAPS